jgi:ribosomal protein S4
MSKKTATADKPQAYLAINKSRVKMYGKKKSIPSYYLEKGQEFQIELYNPTQEKVLTTFKLNNKPLSGGLILRPGERVFLDRYLDKSKKFLFDTYKVENSKSSKKAIEPNGDVEIAFFKEIQQHFIINNGVTLDWMVDDLGTGGNNFIDLSTGNITNTTLYSDTNPDSNITFTSMSNTTDFKGDVKIDGNLDVNGIIRSGNNQSKRFKSKKTKSPDKIETGRVEEGSNSNQKLHEGSGDFEMMSFHVIRYKLFPKSQKKLSTKEYYTKYCWNCGAKCKTPFCPHCGAKQ